MLWMFFIQLNVTELNLILEVAIRFGDKISKTIARVI